MRPPTPIWLIEPRAWASDRELMLKSLIRVEGLLMVESLIRVEGLFRVDVIRVLSLSRV